MSAPNLTSVAPLPPLPFQPPSQSHQVSTSNSHTSRNCATQGVAQDSRTSQVAAEGVPIQTTLRSQAYTYATGMSSGRYGQPQRYSAVYGHGAGFGEGSSSRGRRYPIFVGSLILGILSTILTLISQSVLTHKQGDTLVGYLWFGIVLQILIITWLGVSAFKSFPNSPSQSQPIAHLSSVVIVLASLGIDRHIHSTTSPVQQATGTGWLLILLVDLFWVVYLSSPPHSAIVRFVDGHHGHAHEPTPNVFGLGPIKGETRRFSRPLPTTAGTPPPPTHRYTIPYPEPQSPLNLSKVLQTSGSQRDPASATGPVPVDSESAGRLSVAVSEGRSGEIHGQGQGQGKNSVGPGPVIGNVEGARAGASQAGTGKAPLTPSENVRGAAANGSKNGSSFGAGVGAMTLGSLSSTSTSLTTSEDTRPPTTKESHANNGLGIKGIWKARALYTYKANADDPTELSFTQGELLDILDKSGRWWSVRKADGSVGIAPSNYLIIHTSFY